MARTGHVIASHRANQFAGPRLQPLGADGTILRSIYLRGALFRVRVELRRCALHRLRRNRRRPWLHGMFHGGTVIAHPPVREKLQQHWFWLARVDGQGRVCEGRTVGSAVTIGVWGASLLVREIKGCGGWEEVRP